MSYHAAMRYLLPTICVFSLLACALAYGGEAPAADEVVHTWSRLHINGAYSGYVHTQTRPGVGAEDGEKRIETRATTDMKMKRMGDTIEIHAEADTWETPAGLLLRIETISKMSANTTKTTFTFADGKVKIETLLMGNTRVAESAVDTDLIGPDHTNRSLAKLAGTTGETVTTKTYMPDFQRVVRAVTTSHGKEPVALHDGRMVEATRLTSVLEGLPAMRPVSWMNAEGLTIKTSVKMAGLDFETFTVASKAEALAVGEDSKTSPDVFAETFVYEADPIPVPRHLERATLTLRRKDDGIPFPPFVAEGLVVSKNNEGALVVEAQRAVPPVEKLGLRPLRDIPARLQDALAASSMIQSDADAIRKTAELVVGTETQAWPAAQKLERWVFENMTKKNMSVGFGSASEALESREGDCSEHAVLLAALCRAAGIPARVVMGVEFLFGIWGGHAWNDVWIDGTWYQLDATNGYGFVDPLHLPMAQMVMKEGAESEFAAVMGGIGNLDIDIVSVTRSGRTIRVNDSATLVTTKDGRYRDEIWGIQFDAPQGFVFDPPEESKTLSAKLMELDGVTADGKRVEISVLALDAPAADIEAALRQLGVDVSSAQAGTLDGRPTLTATLNRKTRVILKTGVVCEGALFIFSLDRAGGEPERKAFQAFLATVDLDIK